MKESICSSAQFSGTIETGLKGDFIMRFNKTIATGLAAILGFSAPSALSAQDIQKKAFDQFMTPRSGISCISDYKTPSLEAITSESNNIKLDESVSMANDAGPAYFAQETTAPVKKKGGFPWLIVGAAVVAAGAAIYLLTRKSSTPTPVTHTYNVTIDCDDMTSLQGDNFVPELPVNGAALVIDGQPMSAGTYTFSHTGDTMTVDYTGAVLPDVICIRKPGEKTNVSQALNGAATVDLSKLNQGTSVHLKALKIPSWMNQYMPLLKQTLADGTGVYPNGATAYIVDDSNGAYGTTWTDAKQRAADKITPVLAALSEAAGVPFTLDTNATTGQIKYRLSPSYTSPSSTHQVGTITTSDITISDVSSLADYVEESMHNVTGMKDIINNGVYKGLSDFYNNNATTVQIYRHGKATIRINQTVNPGTTFQ